MSVITKLACLLLVTGAGACTDAYDGEFDSDKQDSTFTEQERELLSSIQVGDIILENSDGGRGCWYLNGIENLAIDPVYCHASLVIAKLSEHDIITIEALNPEAGVSIELDKQYDIVASNKENLAILRVTDDDGKDLDEATLQRVADYAMNWDGIAYTEPPFAQDADPFDKGLYCSMVPYRAYLDVLDIEIDGGWIPFVVTPDNLYMADDTRVVYETVDFDG